MKRFEGADREQSTLFPECLEDWICEDNPVRAIDVFVEDLDLAELSFGGVDPQGQPQKRLPFVFRANADCSLIEREPQGHAQFPLAALGHLCSAVRWVTEHSRAQLHISLGRVPLGGSDLSIVRDRTNV